MSLRLRWAKNRKAQILHTRLRTNCSSLNLDLFLKGITDSPMCRCGSIENSQHFFFHCPYYQQQRNALLNVVSTYHRPTLDLLLYGESSLSYDVNMLIFENIHRFIVNVFHEMFYILIWSCDCFTTFIRCKRYYIPCWMQGAPTPQSQFPTYPLPISPLLPLHPHRPLFCPFTFS